MEVVGYAVILDHAPVFRLVLGHDAVGTVIDSLHEMAGLPGPHILRAVRVHHGARDTEANGSVDTPLTAMVMCIIGVQGVDCIPQERRRLIACMRDARLFLA